MSVKNQMLSQKKHKILLDDFKEEELNVETDPSDADGKPKFQYGNYNRYYGYRLEGSDPRFRFFDPDWFRGKDILDIGCNVGEVTMSIARDMAPKRILGKDILDIGCNVGEVTMSIARD